MGTGLSAWALGGICKCQSLSCGDSLYLPRHNLKCVPLGTTVCTTWYTVYQGTKTLRKKTEHPVAKFHLSPSSQKSSDLNLSFNLRLRTSSFAKKKSYWPTYFGRWLHNSDKSFVRRETFPANLLGSGTQALRHGLLKPHQTPLGSGKAWYKY